MSEVRGDEDIALDVRELVMRLLLTDTVVLRTHRLLETKDVLEVFGARGLLALLESGKLRLTCEAFSVVSTPPNGPRDDTEYQFLVVWASDREQYIRRAVDYVRTLSFSDINEVADAVPAYIEPSPTEESSKAILSQLRQHLLQGAI